MKLKNRKSKIEHRKSRRRASVIVLVVAVLALLAVIGTVYIVAARSDRTAATASNAAANVDNAQKAANELLRSPIGEPIFDANGNVGGLASVGPVGVGMARRHEIGEFNIYQAGFDNFNPAARDQSWLVSNLYRPYRVGFPFSTMYNDMTMPQSRMVVNDTANNSPHWTPSVFNPSSGMFDIPLFTFTNNAPSFNPIFSDTPGATSGLLRVVADSFPSGLLDSGNHPFSAGDDAFVQLLPFSEANGVRYRVGFRIVDASSMANLNVGMTYSLASPDLFESYGTFYNAYSLCGPNIFNSAATFTAADVPNALRTSGAPSLLNPGRQGAWVLPTTYNGANIPLDYVWQLAAYRFEDPTLFPTSPFDLSDELELRSYGVIGTMSVPRPALGYVGNHMWPNTLGNRNPASASVVGNPYRAFYTAYSYSRDLRPYADPTVPGPPPAPDAYVLRAVNRLLFDTPPSVIPPAVIGNNVYVFPPFPACVAANPDSSRYAGRNDQQCADALAIAATNIATVMDKIAGFLPNDSRDFAANYLTARWNTWTLFKAIGGQNVYYLPGGPSYVDDSGMVLSRNDGTNTNILVQDQYRGTFTATTGNKVHLGYAAQPFINEVAIAYHWDQTATTNVEEDCAIELYNPYDVALSLEDYKLIVNGTDVPLDGHDLYVPPRGYFVVTKVTGAASLDTVPTPVPATAVKTDISKLTGASMSLTAGGKIFLMRKYIDRAGTQQYGAVDQYDATPISIATPPATPPADGTKSVDFLARNNRPDTAAEPIAHWASVVHTATGDVKHTHNATVPADTLTLGTLNYAYDATAAYIPLYDRTLELYTPSTYNTDYQRQLLLNVADFARIMHITNQIDASATGKGGPMDNGVISAQLAALIAAPNPQAVNCQFPADASVHFDFRTEPAHYGDVAGPKPYKVGDPRAARLLECLAFSDRVSDFTLNLGDNDSISRGLSKIRIPGRINVNTASWQVLSAIPGLSTRPTLIGTILAYRWRTTTDDPRIPAALQMTGASLLDFHVQTEFPGYGIRSLGELELPVALWLKAYDVANGIPLPTSIFGRDAIWGTIYNSLTVRSDTFVVYAYLEAVRQNPRYGGAFNNGTDWYTTNPLIGITDDPTDATHALLRIARRRWVAIVDRSQSNYGRYTQDNTGKTVLDPRFSLPRIVAQKDLPN